ncbi:hypothetical protein HanXRQr2_Chr05g0204351 [Helianthus annuus]|uniref:Uncharacterized protein n=1 Tax=Helianthus annuus TaxID=4232 RepID=A0A9K3IXH1_HELAN|nr:hypothetical protein HanXRQr2_Chr05g0204351 [Helianthus annuus]KAJ0921896.1 hypothetical protein HanPSC8_Chr05g0197091 [Helianthus annuus]
MISVRVKLRNRESSEDLFFNSNDYQFYCFIIFAEGRLYFKQA